MFDAPLQPRRRLTFFEAEFGAAFAPPPVYIWRLLHDQWRVDEEKMRILARLTDKSRSIIDVGANKGVYTHFLGWCGASVHAFEPNPPMHRVLARAVPPNGTAYAVALSDRNAPTSDLVIPLYGKVAMNADATLDPRAKTRRHKIVEVPCRTLDSFNFRNVGLIKLSVNGSERAVLDGARETIARDRPVLFLTLREGEACGCAATLSYLKTFARRIYFMRDGGQIPVEDFDPIPACGTPARKAGVNHTFIVYPD